MTRVHVSSGTLRHLIMVLSLNMQSEEAPGYFNRSCSQQHVCRDMTLICIRKPKYVSDIPKGDSRIPKEGQAMKSQAGTTTKMVGA
jgi:hypothetical protein